MTLESSLETYFSPFRKNIIGIQQSFASPYGTKQIVYADWTATGRAYQPIEEFMQKQILPFIGNTHSGTTITGTRMSKAYDEAKRIVKKHVGANSDDVLVFCGSGMTGAVNKLQRMLGLKMPERIMGCENKPGLHWDKASKPVVFITHMEHHSNHITWLETVATVEIIQPDEKGNVDLEHFKKLLEQYKNNKNKIAAVTACSNVTGIQTPYHQIAKLIHTYNGLCFVDFACSAPYVHINMHPHEAGAHLDAIYFSPHKFLGGAGTPGVLIFNKKLYANKAPDQPGGGTIVYSNPWKYHEYITDIEQREDGGTPPFLGAIKAAMCIRLKEAMGVDCMLKREKEILAIIFERFAAIKNIKILEGAEKHRLGVVSFIVLGAHYNLIVKMLNDRFGVQTRGGCSCAGTYGHKLLNIDETTSYHMLDKIRSGDLSGKPGWIRLSIHPTMTNAEIHFIMDAIQSTVYHCKEWMKDYKLDPESNEYAFKGNNAKQKSNNDDWFIFASLNKPTYQ